MTETSAGPGWYRGDCHVHSVYSDGALTPERLAADARALGLDFLATTEHNTAEAHAPWARLAAEDLLVVLGEEVTTDDGHWLALGLPQGRLIDWRHGVADGTLARRLREVTDAGGLAVAAHPHAPYPTGTLRFPLQAFDAVEVWNGLWSSDRPWNADNEAALADWTRALAEEVPRGRWRPAIGSSDTHLVDQLGIPHTVVRAGELTVEAILAGLRAGHSWIAGSTSVELTFTAGAAGRRADIGERLVVGAGHVTARAEVRGVPAGTVGFHTALGEAHRAALPATGAGAVTARIPPDGAEFVRVEVRHPSGAMAALGNPIALAPTAG
ncbi:CehA/McbA family metallohydrolase [Streptomyces profundus]|uniref:CehA/McbA family metallohydrolase n=1 Tax=Streptomyces profundus TaxID=2867410 RepID=UPI001D165676|nr:CehA/McbA family metallohydrolase [Streptomyces sp. MA3_2.13]UED87766.1 CehA/McbA family metallohydrolase [Streptomyces sp. MA3_2.13]